MLTLNYLTVQVHEYILTTSFWKNLMLFKKIMFILYIFFKYDDYHDCGDHTFVNTCLYRPYFRVHNHKQYGCWLNYTLYLLRLNHLDLFVWGHAKHRLSEESEELRRTENIFETVITKVIPNNFIMTVQNLYSWNAYIFLPIRFPFKLDKQVWGTYTSTLPIHTANV